MLINIQLFLRITVTLNMIYLMRHKRTDFFVNYVDKPKKLLNFFYIKNIKVSIQLTLNIRDM